MRILNVVVQNESFEYRDNNFVLSYLVDDSVKDPMANLRAAIREYGQTEGGKRDVAHACGYYNWGDASCAVLDEILPRYGLRYMETNAVDVLVNHDEILIDSDDVEQEEEA